MEIEYSSRFESSYKKLPLAIQKKAEQREILFRRNPFHPLLRTHKLHGKLKAFYSFSVDAKYRIAFRFAGASTAVFLDVGDHGIYR